MLNNAIRDPDLFYFFALPSLAFFVCTLDQKMTVTLVYVQSELKVGRRRKSTWSIDVLEK